MAPNVIDTSSSEEENGNNLALEYTTSNYFNQASIQMVDDTPYKVT